MTTGTRRALREALAALSSLYPPMRLGQLVVFAGSLAGDEAPPEVETLGDARLLAAAEDHARRRAAPTAVEHDRSQSGLTPTRRRLLEALEELGQHCPEEPCGQLLAKLAAHARVNLYDAEDEQLLRAAAEVIAAVTANEPEVNYQKVRRLFDPEEIKRRKERWHDDPGRTLDQILERLRCREPGGQSKELTDNRP
jgi:hypothetical protein